MEAFLYNNWVEYLITPLIYVLGICMIARWSGVEVDFSKHRTSKDILQNIFIWFIIIFCGMCLVWLLMTQHELWLAHKWGIELNYFK